MPSDPVFTGVVGAPAARAELGERGKLRLRGSDRVRFLNGMVTSDVEAQAPNTAAAALLLDRKGHVLADLAVLKLDQSLLLDIAPARLPVVVESLERLLVADDVELEPLADLAHLAVEGPGASACVRAAGGPVPAPDQLEAEPEEPGAPGLIWRGGGYYSDDGIQLLGPASQVDAVRGRLGLPELAEPEREVLRLERFEPRYGIDVSDRNFPAEARLESAISFEKGCYVGQEIVARIHSRGSVNRLLVKLGLERAAEPGDEITQGGKVVGQVTSAVLSPVSGALALGYVRRAAAAPETEVEVRGTRARVIGPPLSERAPASIRA